MHEPTPAAARILPIAKFCIVYRTGGRAAFTWKRSLAMSLFDAEQTLASVKDQGFEAYIEVYSGSLDAGLPTTYAYSTTLHHD